MEQEEIVETVSIVKLSQKDAVYKYMTEALNDLPKDSLDSEIMKDRVTKDIRKVVRLRLFAAIKSGEVRVTKQYDDSRLKKYCSGLINNWLKKDDRFKKGSIC